MSGESASSAEPETAEGIRITYNGLSPDSLYYQALKTSGSAAAWARVGLLPVPEAESVEVGKIGRLRIFDGGTVPQTFFSGTGNFLVNLTGLIGEEASNGVRRAWLGDG